MKGENLLTIQAQALQQGLEALALKYDGSQNAQVRMALKKIAGRTKEYFDRSFIILVAGPVKSGKSTFVNLVAGDVVSPTHFLECTVRPSIISSTDKPDQKLITTYTSKDKGTVVAQVDAIIDSIRGHISPEEVPDVEMKSWPLTKDNVTNYVALNIADLDKDGTLLTTIKTPGGKLLTDGVYIVDMPGFDGLKANLDSPLYKTIASRADLIVLVQSSNSAITKVSDEFFNLLKENNRNVPVCLLHNVFDSAYWRDEDSKKKIVDGHVDYALSMVKDKGFYLGRENAYSVNLGMVNDWREKSYETHGDVLQKEAQDFAEIEEKIYNLLIAQRDSIRVRNALSRTLQQIESLMDTVKDRIASMKATKESYDAAISAFDSLRSRKISLDVDVELDYTALKTMLNKSYTMVKKGITGMCSRGTACDIIAEFIEECSGIIGRNVDETLKFIDAQINGEEVLTWKSDIADLLRKYGADESLPVSGAFEFSPVTPDLTKLDSGNIVPILRLAVGQERMNGYLSHVYYYIVGKESSVAGTNSEVGYLDFGLPEQFADEVRKRKEKVLEHIYETYGSFIERKRKEVLDNLIPDLEIFKIESDELGSLINDLESIRKTTENTLKL